MPGAPVDAEDTRKVRTAVSGGSTSATPEFMPYDHLGFDDFMLGRSREDFYCGVLLGGCGKKLTVRRSEIKKCHFAHRPPVHCRRTATGEASADHLYIGQALQQWLRRQGHQAVGLTFPKLGTDMPGAAVDLTFAKGRRIIRVQMARQSQREWETAGVQLRDRYDRVHWTYGPNSGLAHNEAGARGHAVRFECRTQGDTRAVYVGTQFKDHSVRWHRLNECHLSEAGIVTPRLASDVTPAPSALAAQVDPQSVAFPLAPDSVAFTGATTELSGPVTRAAGRQLYDADVHPLGSDVVRARVSLPAGVQLAARHVYVLPDGATLSPLPGVDAEAGEPRFLLRAQYIRRLTPDLIGRWPLLAPTPEPEEPTSTGAADPAPEEPHREPLMSEQEMVTEFRTRLQNVARSRGEVNWETLVSHVGAAPGDFTEEDQVRMLVAVDHPRGTGKPVLSSLVKSARDRSGRLPTFGRILHGLGWKAGLPTAKVAEVHRHERDTAYTLARYPAQFEKAHAASTPKAAPPEENTEAAARLRFGELAEQFRAAQEAGDVSRADAVRKAMGPLYARKISGSHRERLYPIMVEFKRWVRDHSERADPTLTDLRRLLQHVGDQRAEITTEGISGAIAEAELLIGRLPFPLPEPEKKQLGKLRANLRTRRHAERIARTRPTNRQAEIMPPAPLPETEVARCGPDQIGIFATAVREILEAAARAGTTITWSGIRERMHRSLPYLHPDDQGEILVAVDRTTPTDEPLLSALVTGPDMMLHGLYRHVRYSLGREAVPPDALEMHWRMDIFKLHQLYRHR